MSVIRQVYIRNFRGIESLFWNPHPGLNCLIGPGDSGKSTILDAIDLCLGARRNFSFTDADSGVTAIIIIGNGWALSNSNAFGAITSAGAFYKHVMACGSNPDIIRQCSGQ
ncbi:AAA family ATPase [Echinimonas agarilytica]|uniref:AAA family ATPase n=1 Tax=Echinimonas agarilytica TaxID=1215918 RepID=UPI003D81001D